MIINTGAGYVGHTTVGAGRDSQAGYTLLMDDLDPVVVEDLQSEVRFSIAPLLYEHDVVSGISVAIRTQKG